MKKREYNISLFSITSDRNLTKNNPFRNDIHNQNENNFK